MNYWMTTHWPPDEYEDLDTFVPRGVWLPDGREQAGADIEVGDRVLIYQSKTGGIEIKNIKGKEKRFRPIQGREGIIAICEITGDLEERKGSKPSKYTSRKDIWWRWYADTEPITMNGYVSRSDVNRILGYKPGYTLRAFGNYKSGLKKLEKNQYDSLIEDFHSHPRRIDLVRQVKNNGWGPGAGGESEEHRSLKEYVASDPSQILEEEGLETIRMEYPFPSADKADIVLRDADGKIVGVEIEIDVNENQLAGVLQAIKYRYMLALMEERRNFETRAFLVAKTISPAIIDLCNLYEVECFTVKES